MTPRPNLAGDAAGAGGAMRDHVGGSHRRYAGQMSDPGPNVALHPAMGTEPQEDAAK